MKPKILIIYTGGTIGMQQDENGTLVPFDFNSIEMEFPAVRTLNVDLEVCRTIPIDSSNVTPQRWQELAEVIKENYEKYDGFVILHGTDTMSYTASALSFMLRNLAKPVVFTGSQIPMGILRTDGRENLITAIEIAAAQKEGKPIVPEVSLYFQNRLFRANRSSKLSAEALSAFDSRNYPPLAEVGVNIQYNTDFILYPTADAKFEVDSTMSDKVVILKLFPGIAQTTINAILGLEGLRGVVLETYGAGNAPTAPWFLKSIVKAIENNVTIVNITQCHGGCVNMELYETGLKLQKAGVVCGYDMTTEAAVTKLMWLLGKNLSQEEVTKQLLIPLCGEFSC